MLNKKKRSSHETGKNLMEYEKKNSIKEESMGTTIIFIPRPARGSSNINKSGICTW